MELTRCIEVLEVGQKLKSLEGLPSDGFWFDLHDGYMSMYINYNSPTKEDIALILNSEVNLKIGTLLGNLLVGLDIKDFGVVDTLYAEVYTRHQHKLINVTELDYVSEGFEGLENCPLTLYIIDTESSVCVGKRTLTLGKEALEHILTVVKNQEHIHFDVEPAVMVGAFVHLKDYIQQCTHNYLFKTSKQYIF